MESVPPDLFRVVVDSVSLAVFVFRRNRLVYSNGAAEGLGKRLRAKYHIELEVVLRDHLRAFSDQADRPKETDDSTPTVTLLTATTGEPFQIHVMPLGRGLSEVAVSVRAIGAEIDAFRRRYKLSAREAQVAELVLHGYKNTDIAAALGIASATTKKHLTRIFDKVGVDTRSQLQTRLA